MCAERERGGGRRFVKEERRGRRTVGHLYKPPDLSHVCQLKKNTAGCLLSRKEGDASEVVRNRRWDGYRAGT